MKALSFRQPWAELILQGRKTIDLRTWATRHRGRIAIHASQKVDREICAAYGLDPASLTLGALVGTVDVVDILPLDDERWEALRDQHMKPGPFPGDLLGWRLDTPRRLPRPVPMRGRLGLFEVPDELLEQGGMTGSQQGAADDLQPAPQDQPGRPAPRYRVGTEASYDPEKPFELRVVPHAGRDYSLALYQWPVASTSNAGGDSSANPARPERLVELGGDSLRAVADHVLEALRAAGYRATDLSRERRAPFRLDEETGLRLGLLFLAVKPLARMDRVEAISGGLRTMPSEEAYYWFSKCTAGPNAVNARRALRILLAGE
ncbi:MAG: hypothetical protein Kow0063_41740 [Anaerolineae bacterium]